MKRTYRQFNHLYLTMVVLFSFCFLFSMKTQAQSYEQLWKNVENFQKKDLPRSAMQEMSRIYEKAHTEKNIGQLMKAVLSRASEQVKLTSDSVEVEIARLKSWADRESNQVTRALLNYVIGNAAMQQRVPDWKEAMHAYRCALQEKNLLLNTSAADYAPLTQSTDFSTLYFQDNLYDLLVHQIIAGLQSSWEWRNKVDVQKWIIDLYDSLIDSYGVNGLQNPTAVMLSHEAKILFLNGKGVADQFRISDENAENSFKDLLCLYEDGARGNGRISAAVVAVDAFVDVYLNLADKLCDQQKFAEAVEVVRKAQKRYPKTIFKEALSAKLAWINRPSLSLEIPMTYPSYRGQFVVNYKNITEVKVEMYRLGLTSVSPELNRHISNEDLCRTYGQKVFSKRYHLPATNDYRMREEKVSFQLPEAGIYVMKAIPVGREGEVDYRLVHVSPYQCLFIPLDGGRSEVVVVDRLSGNPVPHAEVVEYDREQGTGLFKVVNVWKANLQGSVVLDSQKWGARFVNARTSKNDFMKITSVYFGRNLHQNFEKGWMQMTTLFTDRALYRPGQVVHMSGVRYEQLGDSLRTVTGKVMKIELLDANGRKVSEASAATDLLGVFAADFVLPQQVLPGYFTLRTENKAMSIRVENYKRPTFDVVFAKADKTYTFGDVVKVEGTVQTFAGAPVRLAKGSYKIMRSEVWWWRGSGAETLLASGSFTTDAKGNFAVDVDLETPLNQKSLRFVPYYNYTIKAFVTDGAGETQQGVLVIPVGEQSLGIQIQGLKPKMAREHQEKIQFQTMNLSKLLVNTEVTYQVFEMKGNSFEKERIVFTAKTESQHAFVPKEVYALPSGKYRMKVSARDDQGRLVVTSQDFILFSLTDKCPPIQTTQWFYQDGSSWENDKTVSVYVGSSEKKVYLLMDVFTADKRIRSERIQLNNSIRKFEFAYDESYGDGIAVSFAFLRDGRLYTQQVRLEKPKPQKELTLKWETFRDQLTPGRQEVWRMKITDRSGNPVSANLLATLYDASLDRLQSHDWWLQPSFGRNLPYIGVRSLVFERRTMCHVNFPHIQLLNGYDLLNPATYSSLFPFSIGYSANHLRPMSRVYPGPVFAMKSVGAPRNEVQMDGNMEMTQEEGIVMDEGAVVVPEVDQEEQEVAMEEMSLQPLRRNFSETAFYYPMMRTDSNGEVSISFTLPDALTEWIFMGVAHTKQLDCGKLTSKVRASKPFMVQPNLPRFVRVGDASSLAVSLVNLSMDGVEGKVRMELVDPMTERIVFKQVREFKVAEGETGVAQFDYKVLDQYDVLVCRVVAEAGEFSDGEQHYLPVLGNKEWVTETIPFQVNGRSGVDLSLKELFNSQSGTATGQRLTVELTANTSWYVIQALPVAGNPTSDDAVSWATAYYANALAAQFVRNHPRIQQVFETWKAEAAAQIVSKDELTNSLWSKLQTNADLKNLLLEETPWLAEAATETEQKQRVALLFEMNGMEQRLQLAAHQLRQLQTSEGGWTWYPGMPVNRYTTTQIVELMARLKAMGVMVEPSMVEAYRRGLEFLKQEAKDEYERMVRLEAEIQRRDAHPNRALQRMTPSEQAIHYLYICAIDHQAQRAADDKVNAFFIDRLMKHKTAQSLSIYEKALMATVMQANGKLDEAAILLKSLKEYLVSAPEMGSYFDTYKATYSWNSYRIPTHVAAMEAFQRISPDIDLLNGMKLWLLKQKQVQVWNTPIATVDAIYAFMLTDSSMSEFGQGSASKDVSHQPDVVGDWTGNGKMKVVIGNVGITTPNDALGYTRQTVTGARVRSKALHVEKEGDGIGWGTVYAQYFERMDRLNKAQDKGVSIKREYLLNEEKLQKNTVLHVGDKVTIRLIIKVDRDMDFVMVKDQHAACMEPAEQLSGYEWKHGLGAYRVNHDASTEFFMDKMPKGSYVLEYGAFVNREGTYQTGSAIIQSVYAPEFASHTQGDTLVVE